MNTAVLGNSGKALACAQRGHANRRVSRCLTWFRYSRPSRDFWLRVGRCIAETSVNLKKLFRILTGRVKRFSSVFPQIILYKYAHTCLLQLDRMQCSCVRPFLIQSSWLLRCRSISTFVALLLFLFGTVSGILICLFIADCSTPTELSVLVRCSTLVLFRPRSAPLVDVACVYSCGSGYFVSLLALWVFRLEYWVAVIVLCCFLLGRL